MTIVFDIPIKTPHNMNSRLHWAERARSTKSQRTFTKLRTGNAMQIAGAEFVGRIPTSVTLTRKYSGRHADPDGLAGYLKAIQDGIAEAIGFDDGDVRCQWLYRQRKAKRKDFGVEVEVRYT